MIELKKPSVKGIKDYEKIEELRKYLYSLVDDLQFALQDLETKILKVNTTLASINNTVNLLSVSTTEYSTPTDDAIAFDGIAYSGEEMPTIPEGETIEEGDESDEQG